MITLSLALPVITSKHESWDIVSKVGSVLVMMCIDALYIVPILL